MKLTKRYLKKFRNQSKKSRKQLKKSRKQSKKNRKQLTRTKKYSKKGGTIYRLIDINSPKVILNKITKLNNPSFNKTYNDLISEYKEVVERDNLYHINENIIFDNKPLTGKCSEPTDSCNLKSKTPGKKDCNKYFITQGNMSYYCRNPITSFQNQCRIIEKEKLDNNCGENILSKIEKREKNTERAKRDNTIIVKLAMEYINKLNEFTRQVNIKYYKKYGKQEYQRAQAYQKHLDTLSSQYETSQQQQESLSQQQQESLSQQQQESLSQQLVETEEPPQQLQQNSYKPKVMSLKQDAEREARAMDL
jgi:hypothetical protein